MIGYFKNNRYENAYGTPISCFKCGENKCNGSTIAITLAGTPKKAAGINKNVNKFINEELFYQ